jgi:hypothetical protein
LAQRCVKRNKTIKVDCGGLRTPQTNAALKKGQSIALAFLFLGQRQIFFRRLAREWFFAVIWR